jgi:hypothetical protein
MTKFLRLAMLLCMPLLMFANAAFSQNSPSINQKQLKKDLVGHWKVVDTEIELGDFLEEVKKYISDSSDLADFISTIDQQELLENLKRTYESWQLHFFKNGDVFFEMNLPLLENRSEKFKWRFSEANNDIMFAGLATTEYQSALVVESYDEKNQLMKVRLNSGEQSSLQISLWFKRIGKPNKKLYRQSKTALDKKILGTYSVKDIIGLELEISNDSENWEVVDITPQARMQNITFYSDGLYVIRNAQTNQALASGLLTPSLNSWMMLPNDMGFFSNATVDFTKNNTIIFLSNYWGDDIQVVLQKEKKTARPTVPDFNSKAQKKGANNYIVGSWRAIRNSNDFLELSATLNIENIDEDDYVEYLIIENSVFYALEDQKSAVFDIDAQGNMSFAGLNNTYSAGKLTWNEKRKLYELIDAENNHYTLEKLSHDFVRIIIKNEVYGEMKFLCEISSDEMDFLNLAAEQMFSNSDWDFDFDWSSVLNFTEYRPLEDKHPIFGTWTVSRMNDLEPGEYFSEEFFLNWDTITIFKNGTMAYRLAEFENEELLAMWTLSASSDDTLEMSIIEMSRSFIINFLSNDEFEVKDPLNEEHHFKFNRTNANTRYSIVQDEKHPLVGCWSSDSSVYNFDNAAGFEVIPDFSEDDLIEFLNEMFGLMDFCFNDSGKFKQIISRNTKVVDENINSDDSDSDEFTIVDENFDGDWLGFFNRSREKQWYLDEKNKEIIINHIFYLENFNILKLTATELILEKKFEEGYNAVFYFSRR